MADRFDEFWNAYPKRDARKKAVAIWKREKLDSKAGDVIAGARRYAEWCKANARDRQYIKLPTTWLNGEHWTDELDGFQKPSSGQPNNLTRLHDTTEGRAQLLFAFANSERNFDHNNDPWPDQLESFDWQGPAPMKPGSLFSIEDIANAHQRAAREHPIVRTKVQTRLTRYAQKHGDEFQLAEANRVCNINDHRSRRNRKRAS